MKKTIIALCVSAMALPLAVTAAPAVAQDGLSIQFGSRPSWQLEQDERRNWQDRDGWRERQFRREMQREQRDFQRERRNARNAYHNGYRGHRQRQPGYVFRDGWWFPPAAFALGAIVGGAIANDTPRYAPRARGSAHVDWCYNRYRSYRASDNTFQPYNGPRQQCYSPYS